MLFPVPGMRRCHTRNPMPGTYPPEDMGKEKSPVTVRLVIESERLIHGGSGGRGTLAWEEIHIGWEGNDTAVVGI